VAKTEERSDSTLQGQVNICSPMMLNAREPHIRLDMGSPKSEGKKHKHTAAHVGALKAENDGAND